MSHALYHSISSQKKWGGKWKDYYEYHKWYDESKEMMIDVRHRALRHHTEGIFMAEKIFGPVIVNSDGKQVPTRLLGEQHVMEDLGFIPSVQDWFKNMKIVPWMTKPGEGRKLEGEIAEEKSDHISNAVFTTHKYGTKFTQRELDEYLHHMRGEIAGHLMKTIK